MHVDARNTSMTATTRPEMSVSEPTLYVAFELGKKEWKLAMTSGFGVAPFRPFAHPLGVLSGVGIAELSRHRKALEHFLLGGLELSRALPHQFFQLFATQPLEFTP